MAYTAGTPLPDENPTQSQGLFLANFGAIAAALATNHGAFNDSLQGKHTFLQMPQQTSAPATTSTEGGLFTQDTAGNPELFWVPNTSGTPIQLTDSKANTLVSAENGSTFLAGGIILKWGINFNVSTSLTPINFVTAFPTNIFCVVCTADKGELPTIAVTTDTISLSGFNALIGSGNLAVRYIAIGN